MGSPVQPANMKTSLTFLACLLTIALGKDYPLFPFTYENGLHPDDETCLNDPTATEDYCSHDCLVEENQYCDSCIREHTDEQCKYLLGDCLTCAHKIINAHHYCERGNMAQTIPCLTKNLRKSQCKHCYCSYICALYDKTSNEICRQCKLFRW